MHPVEKQLDKDGEGQVFQKFNDSRDIIEVSLNPERLMTAEASVDASTMSKHPMPVAGTVTFTQATTSGTRQLMDYPSEAGAQQINESEMDLVILRSSGACTRCKELMMLCEFSPDSNTCRHCESGRYQCMVDFETLEGSDSDINSVSDEFEEQRSASCRLDSGVESAATRLLAAIQQLLEALTQLSAGRMTRAEFGDIHIGLGSNFSAAFTALEQFDIDLSELMSVPNDLSNILGASLAEGATPSTINARLHDVHNIIIKLLQGLWPSQSIYTIGPPLSQANSSSHNIRTTRPAIPDDEDLSNLYNDILASFQEEGEGEGIESFSGVLGAVGFSGAPGEPKNLSIYDSYGAEPSGHLLAMSPYSTDRTQNYGISSARTSPVLPPPRQPRRNAIRSDLRRSESSNMSSGNFDFSDAMFPRTSTLMPINPITRSTLERAGHIQVPRGFGIVTARSSSSSSSGDNDTAIIQSTPATTGFDVHTDEKDGFEDIDDEDPSRYVNLALLSNLAVQLRDKVPRGTHIKRNIPYDHAFTGKDIVSTIQSQIQRTLLINLGISTNDRRTALCVAHSLQTQVFFYEVEWDGRQLSDGVEDVFLFLDDVEGESGEGAEREELPTGVITRLTKCYAPSCVEGEPCYTYDCPRRVSSQFVPHKAIQERPQGTPWPDNWTDNVDHNILRLLPESEIRRQTVIRNVIEKEEQYVRDMDTIESVFIMPLRKNSHEVIPPDELHDFIDAVFGIVLDLRECNRRLLETMYIRQREQAPIIQRIGDIFLTAAMEFQLPYSNYAGHLLFAENKMKDELEHNSEFQRFIEICSNHSDARRFDLRHFITLPSEHLQRYPVLLEAILKDTAEGNPDAGFLQEAIQAIQKLIDVSHVRMFQTAMLRGPTAKLEWHNLVSAKVRESMTEQDVARQEKIFELIKGEMEYVKDLENINSIFIQPLRSLNPPVIPYDRLPQFIEDVFCNFAEILSHHRLMLGRLHEIQQDEHPIIHSITAAIFEAALNWQVAYMNFIAHYPIAASHVEDEITNNLAFKTFVEQCTRHHDARKLDIKAFIYRPIARLLRYDFLLKAIMAASPTEHDDKEAIPRVLAVINSLGKGFESSIGTTKQKGDLWKYNSNMVFGPGKAVDMDLLAETRTLVHTGKLLCQPDTGIESSGWSEIYALLFDNYLVMTNTKEEDDNVIKYHVNRHPIPLDLLTLANFTDPAQRRGAGILRGLRGEGHADGANPGPMPIAINPDPPIDSQTVFPCTIHYNGRLGGLYTVYAESAQARMEWKDKLEEALALRKAVTDNNKVFEVETLSSSTFLVPSLQGASSALAAGNQETVLTGKVTCSVPFSTADGTQLVAIGCTEGVWIGLRHDSKSMRHVLHLKMVTQCAVLEDFGIFLVLADKSLWAYHIEALVPSSPSRSNTTRAPQKLNNHKGVQFFSVGTLNGHTLLIYMKKKALDSVFYVLEPVVGKIPEKHKTPGTFGSSLFGSQRSDWFRPYQEFFLPSESFDLIFLKGKIAVLCTKGFEIMDLTDLKSVTIPQKDDPRHAPLAKRCETSRPLGMFRSSENEFLLCYDEFGIYVDRYGDPSRTTGLIEWEGTAERAACHPPYVLLFDTRFIEVRHIDTGRLAQIIQGTEMHCVWDGRGSSAPQVTTPDPHGWQKSLSQEARVHVVMHAPELSLQPGSRPIAAAQQVVELLPLFPPGSLSSPTASTPYFLPNPSPPYTLQVGSTSPQFKPGVTSSHPPLNQASPGPPTIPFLDNVSLLVDAIDSLASCAGIHAQESLELAANCRDRLYAFNLWIQRPGADRLSMQDFDAAEELRDNLAAVEQFLLAQVDDDSVAHTYRWNEAEFQILRKQMLRGRYYWEVPHELGEQRFEQARSHDISMTKRISSEMGRSHGSRFSATTNSLHALGNLSAQLHLKNVIIAALMKAIPNPVHQMLPNLNPTSPSQTHTPHAVDHTSLALPYAWPSERFSTDSRPLAPISGRQNSLVSHQSPTPYSSFQSGVGGEPPNQPPQVEQVGEVFYGLHSEAISKASVSTAEHPIPSSAGVKRDLHEMGLEEKDGDNSTEGKEDAPESVQRLLGACHRCRMLKMRCVFSFDSNICHRCSGGGHQCIVRRRKARLRSKRENLLAQLHQQDEIIASLIQRMSEPTHQAPVNLSISTVASLQPHPPTSSVSTLFLRPFSSAPAPGPPNVPFLNNASLMVDNIESLASSASIFSQQCLEISARCRILLGALNSWVQRPGNDSPSLEDFEAAEELKSDFEEVEDFLIEKADDPATVAQRWDEIQEQFDVLRRRLFGERYYLTLTESEEQEAEHLHQQLKVYDKDVMFQPSSQLLTSAITTSGPDTGFIDVL